MSPLLAAQALDTRLVQQAPRAKKLREVAVTTEGFLTGVEVRRLANFFTKKHEDFVRATVVERFFELVVDEVQDCSTADVQLLGRLQGLGLNLVTVGDPDQAIYTFRGVDADASTQLALMSESRPIRLTGNWRSTSNICALAAGFRADPEARVPDIALSDYSGEDIPIILIGADSGGSLERFQSVADGYGIRPRERVVLAHGATSLPGMTSSSRVVPKDAATALIWSIGLLRHGRPGKRLTEKAFRVLEGLLANRWRRDSVDLPRERWEDELGLAPVTLRRAALAALSELPALDLNGADWYLRADTAICSLAPAGTGTTGDALQVPEGRERTRAILIAGLKYGSLVSDSLRSEVIHQMKGDEIDAVLVTIPNDDRGRDVILGWHRRLPAKVDDVTVTHSRAEEKEIQEALRVLYVAVTRARRLVALSLPNALIEPTEAALRRAGVPVLVDSEAESGSSC